MNLAKKSPEEEARETVRDFKTRNVDPTSRHAKELASEHARGMFGSHSDRDRFMREYKKEAQK